jgi:hypothetical protein
LHIVILIDCSDTEVHVDVFVHVKEQNQELKDQWEHQVESSIAANHRKLKVKHKLHEVYPKDLCCRHQTELGSMRNNHLTVRLEIV